MRVFEQDADDFVQVIQAKVRFDTTWNTAQSHPMGNWREIHCLLIGSITHEMGIPRRRGKKYRYYLLIIKPSPIFVDDLKGWASCSCRMISSSLKQC